MMWWHRYVLKHTMKITNVTRSTSGFLEKWKQCECGKGWWVEIDSHTGQEL